MIFDGSVPFFSSSNTVIWFLWVLSAPAWHAATPMPGTITAWRSIRSREPIGCRLGKPAWATQVAEATMTSPVSCRSQSPTRSPPPNEPRGG